MMILVIIRRRPTSLMRSEICDERKFHVWSNLMENAVVLVYNLKNSELGTCNEDTFATCLDGLGRFRIANIHNVIHMIAKCNEKVKEKFTSTLHFCLHGSAPLKCLATSDD